MKKVHWKTRARIIREYCEATRLIIEMRPGGQRVVDINLEAAKEYAAFCAPAHVPNTIIFPLLP